MTCPLAGNRLCELCSFILKSKICSVQVYKYDENTKVCNLKLLDHCRFAMIGFIRCWPRLGKSTVLFTGQHSKVISR